MNKQNYETLHQTSDQLYQQWENHWIDGNKENLTWVGKLMLGAKKRALRDVLRSIKVSRAIDVGCGLGFTLSVFKELDINAIGIDVSKTTVEICQKKGLKAVVKKLEEVIDKYDLVFSDGLLEHFLNFEPYAQHLTRISNNYIIIIQTDHENFLGKTSIYLAEILRGSKNVLEYNYRINDFVSVFKNYGLKLIQTRSIFGGIFKLLLFEKDKKIDLLKK